MLSSALLFHFSISILLVFISCNHPTSPFPLGSDSKESTYNVGELDFVPGLGRSHGRGRGNLFSILAWRIPMDRGARQATAWGHKQSDMTEQLSTHTHTHWDF